MNKIHCLIVSGGMLNSEMCNKLYQVARDMLLANSSSKAFKTRKMEGVVSTQHKYAGIGSIYGTECTAEFECEGKENKIRVKYIMMKPYLPDSLMDEGEWVSLADYMEEIRQEQINNPYFDQAMNANNN